MTPMTQSDTRGRILDAATRLYSTNGVGATSVRAIIGEAGVNLNAIHYHFGSKQAVTREVFGQLMAPINRERRELLDRVAADGPTIESLIRAVWWPLIRRAAQSDWRRQILIASQLRHDPSPEAREILADNQNLFAPQFEALLEKATGLTEPQLRLAIRIANAAAWGLVTQPALMDALLSAGDPPQRIRSVFDQFIAFASAGIRSLTAKCERRSSNRKKGSQRS